MKPTLTFLFWALTALPCVTLSQKVTLTNDLQSDLTLWDSGGVTTGGQYGVRGSSGTNPLETGIPGYTITVSANKKLEPPPDTFSGGWNILQPNFDTGIPQLDGLALEWEYFMIHDTKLAFTGLVGFVISDPNGFQQGIAPSGGNVLFSGLIGNKTFASFQSYGLKNYTEERTRRSFQGGTRDSVDYARLTPNEDGTTFFVEGQDKNYQYNFFVREAFSSRNRETPFGDPDAVFSTITALDIGGPGESWSVDSVWPRSKVDGWLRDLNTGETIPIDGHGYRENAYGRWAFLFGGWDFVVMSDSLSKAKVQFVLQSYYTLPRPDGTTPGPSTDNDIIDLSFDRTSSSGRVRRIAQRFRNITLVHPTWEFNVASNQCRPLTSFVTAENALWKVNASWAYENRQEAILSNFSVATRAFVIQEHFPLLSGAIFRKRNDGTEVLVDTFSGVAGGEFSSPRSPSPIPLTPEQCVFFGFLTGAS